MNDRRESHPLAPPGARARAVDCVVLIAWYIAVRAPFLASFDLVSHDGTYYIVQARHLFAGTAGAGAFPPGYPALIAAFMTVIGDGVRAAQTASAFAGVVTTVALYALGLRLELPRAASLACAAVLAATPVFVRATLNTMSESAYVACLLLSLVAYARHRRAWSGAALGAAALTRPEAIGVAAVLAAAGGSRRNASALGAGFLGVYSAGIAASFAGGHTALVSKWHLLGASARGWRDFEAAVGGAAGARPAPGAVIAGYAERLPADLAQLFLHVGGVAFVLALAAAARRRSFVLAALAPLVLVPLFTYRVEPRFIVPFVPVCILCAFVAAAGFARARARRLAYAVLVAGAALGVFVNRAELTSPESEGFAAAREAGRALRDRIGSDARIADRKPFVAFYAGARYVEIPRGAYHDALADVFDDADYLALMRGVTDFFRPELTPLLYDADAILGELRFSQFYANDGGVMVYARSGQTDADGGLRIGVIAVVAPGGGGAGLQGGYARSADGARVAVAGGPAMRSLVVGAGAGVDTLVTRGARVSQPAWAPDGARVAFVCVEAGAPDVFVVDVQSGAVSPVAPSPAREVDPAWDGDDAVVFASDRTGSMEVWRAPLAGGGGPEQLTFTAGNRRPAVSPDGSRLAWVGASGRVVIRDRARHLEWYAATPARVTSAPSWSPDGTCLAVGSDQPGGSDIYLVRSDGTRALRLTAFTGDESAPQWGTGSFGLAFEMDRGGERVVAVVDGLEPYLERLLHPPDLRVFSPPQAK